MNKESKIVPFKPHDRTAKETVLIVAVPRCAKIDPKDARNCLSDSWENRTDAAGRCPGIGTVLDSDNLVCNYFMQENPVRFDPFDIQPTAILHTPDGKIAQWGTRSSVRRCAACIIGETIMKKKNR